MKISYSNDAQKGPGHGLLTFSEERFPGGPYSLAVLRASDQASLAPGAGGGTSWVGETRFIPIQAEMTPDGALMAPIGPEVVNALDPLEQYLVTLKPGQGEPVRGRLRVQGIVYSPDSALDNTGAPAPEPPRPAMAEAPAPPPPAPEPPAPAPEEPPAVAPAPEAPLPEPAAPPEAAPRSRRWLIPLLVALVAALLAGGFATWKFFESKAQEERAGLSRNAEPGARNTEPGARNTEPEPRQAPEATEAPSSPEPAPAPEASTPSTTLPATPKTAEEQVRDFFSGPDITAGAALALAAELPHSTPGEQDALYRLYYFAASSEAPGAFMPYATCLDPSEPPWGTIEKDAAAAYAAYAKAAASDPKVAKAALEAQTRLRAWLEREAAGGNARARAWLQELP